MLTVSSDDDEDEAAELMRELEKIKRERLAQKEKEVPSSNPIICVTMDGHSYTIFSGA